MNHAKTGPMLLCLTVLAGGCTNSKPIIKTVPVEVVRYQTVPVDAALLKQHCADVHPSLAQTNADLEALATELYACVQDHNADKRKIAALK